MFPLADYLAMNRALEPLAENESDSRIFRLQSSWFTRFTLPIQLIETLPPVTHTPTSNQALSIPPSVLKADIPIFLLNPVTTPLSSLLKQDFLLKNPNAIVLLTPVPSSSSLSEYVQHALSSIKDESLSEQKGAAVIFVDPEMALQATQTLREDSRATKNVEEYRIKYMNSHIGDVNTAISTILQRAGSIYRLREQTALGLIHRAIEECKHTVKNAEKDLDLVSAQVSDLRGQVEQAKVMARGEVLGHKGGDEVHKAMNHAEKEMKETMDGLTWWAMLGRVDEIGMIVGNAVRRIWCRELEDKVNIAYS